MTKLYKIPLVLSPQPEGGFTVTSPVLPELLTEVDRLEDLFSNVQDAVKAVLEIYEDTGRDLPPSLRLASPSGAVWFETLVAAS